jgi:hypothetical protein
VDQKGTDLAPGRIGHDPIDFFRPIKKIISPLDFARGRAGQVRQKMPFSTARLQNATRRGKMPNQTTRHFPGGLHHIITDIIPVRLKSHAKFSFYLNTRNKSMFLSIKM